MIVKIKLNTEQISSWAFQEADEIYVHKQFANEVGRGCYSFYSTKKVTTLQGDGDKFPIVYYIVLVKLEKGSSNQKYHNKNIVVPVAGSEVYLLSNEGKTIEKLN